MGIWIKPTFPGISFISMDSFPGHPHSAWKALVSKQVSTQYLRCPLHCSTNLWSIQTLAISSKCLLAQLETKAGILQPSYRFSPGEVFPFREAAPCFPHIFSTWACRRRGLLLQKLQEPLQLSWAGKSGGQSQQFTYSCTPGFGQAKWVCCLWCLLTAYLKPGEPECCRGEGRF